MTTIPSANLYIRLLNQALNLSLQNNLCAVHHYVKQYQSAVIIGGSLYKPHKPVLKTCLIEMKNVNVIQPLICNEESQIFFQFCYNYIRLVATDEKNRKVEFLKRFLFCYPANRLNRIVLAYHIQSNC